MRARVKPAPGFTLLELLVAMGVFLIICATMFELLDLAQKKYSSETQVTAAYQDARLALDQMVRDINISGYPSPSLFSVLPSATQYASNAVAWSPSYPLSPCTIGTGMTGGSCATPGDYDLILETTLPGDHFVSWIWYHLDPGTLTFYREVVPKSGGDPMAAVMSAGTQTALVKNVVNVPGALQAQISAAYPSLFQNQSQVPVFQYTCRVPVTQAPTGLEPCVLAGAYNSPKFISDVDVTLIAMTPQRDLQTQTVKLVELSGRGHRANPTN